MLLPKTLLAVVLVATKCWSGLTQSVNIAVQFDPPALKAPHMPNDIDKNGLNWEQKINVTINFNLQSGPDKDNLRLIRANFQCEDQSVCLVRAHNPTAILFDANKPSASLEVTVEGMFIGKTQLVLVNYDTEPADIDLKLEMPPYEINILRTTKGETLSKVMTGVMIVFGSFMTFLMGTQLQVPAIKKCFLRPIGPAIGFCCQYIGMPLLAFAWATLLLDGYPSLQFGFFAIGCAPGGGASNMWTILLDGNIDLSITMTFVSNVAALAMVPFWLYTVGRSFYGGDQLHLPFDRIAMSLASLIIPAALGITLAHYRPQVVEKARKVLKIFTLCLLIFVICFASYSSWYIFLLMRWYTVVPGMLLPWSGFLCSYLFARLLRQTPQDARTIAIETGIQNGSIAMVICLLSLPQPDADMTVVMPVCTMMVTALPLWVWLIVRALRRKFCGWEDPDLVKDADKDTGDTPKATVNSKGSSTAAKVGPVTQAAPTVAYIQPKESEC